MGKTGSTGDFAGYDEYVPMIDKAVDASWKKQPALQKPYASKGNLILSLEVRIYCLTGFVSSGLFQI